MGNAIFPTLPGLAWSAVKSPQWSTAIQKAISGKEVRRANQARPIWKFSLTYEVLRGASLYNEFQQLLGFYNARQGAFDSFLFMDPSDNTVTSQSIGTGDGVTTVYPLTHAIGAWYEPVGNAPAPLVYSSGIQLYLYPRTNLSASSDTFGSGWGGASVSAGAGGNYLGSPYQTISKVLSTANENRSTSIGAIVAGTPVIWTLALRAGAVSTLSLGVYDATNGGTGWGPTGSSKGSITSGPGSITQINGGLFTVSGLSASVDTVVQITRVYTAACSGAILLYPGTASSTTSGDSIQATRSQVEVPQVASYGAEFVTNGTFDTGISGWAVSASGTMSWSGGRIAVTNNSVNGKVTQTLTGLVVGRTYLAIADLDRGTAGYATLAVDTVYRDLPLNGAPARLQMMFVAASTTASLQLQCSSQTAGTISYFDNVSVKEVTLTTPSKYILTTTSAVTVPADCTTDGVNLTFAAAPAVGAALTWSGQFYYRVRFDKDVMDFEEFMNDFWALKKCDLTGVI